MAAGLADGVPAGGDPERARLRRVRVPRPVGHRAAHRRPGRARVPERVPPSRRACRVGSRDVRERVHVPLSRLVLRRRRTNTFVPRKKTFAEHNLRPDDVNLVPVRCETWGGCAWINFDDDAPPLRDLPRARSVDPRRVEGRVAAYGVVVRVPAAGELEARGRGVRRELPRRGNPSAARHPHEVRTARRSTFDARAFVDADIQYLRTMSDGMAGMVHADDVRVAESLRDIELPSDADTRSPSGTERSTTRWLRGIARPGTTCPTSTSLRPRA